MLEEEEREVNHLSYLRDRVSHNYERVMKVTEEIRERLLRRTPELGIDRQRLIPNAIWNRRLHEGGNTFVVKTDNQADAVTAQAKLARKLATAGFGDGIGAYLIEGLHRVTLDHPPLASELGSVRRIANPLQSTSPIEITRETIPGQLGSELEKYSMFHCQMPIEMRVARLSNPPSRFHPFADSASLSFNDLVARESTSR